MTLLPAIAVVISIVYTGWVLNLIMVWLVDRHRLPEYQPEHGDQPVWPAYRPYKWPSAYRGVIHLWA